jgi:mannitol-specific phosphotransferase system IIBC component
MSIRITYERRRVLLFPKWSFQNPAAFLPKIDCSFPVFSMLEKKTKQSKRRELERRQKKKEEKRRKKQKRTRERNLTREKKEAAEKKEE